jgi:hypothetical protein
MANEMNNKLDLIIDGVKEQYRIQLNNQSIELSRLQTQLHEAKLESFNQVSMLMSEAKQDRIQYQKLLLEYEILKRQFDEEKATSKKLIEEKSHLQGLSTNEREEWTRSKYSMQSEMETLRSRVAGLKVSSIVHYFIHVTIL